MKKFIELIERVHKERFSVVMGKIIAEKIPVAFLSLAPIEQASRNVASLIANSNINIKTLITNQPNTPPRRV